MGESDRIEAAISFTLCELATARHHSIPLECTPFSVGQRLLGNGKIAQQSSCVEALSRSAQHWSSYSGYLREIPQLCFAFRRWHDLDNAKLLYRNATVEKIALLQFMHRRESAQLAKDEERGAMWEETFNRMTSLFDEIQVAGRDMSTSIQEEAWRVGKQVDMLRDGWKAASISIQLEVTEALNQRITESASAMEGLSVAALVQTEAALKSAIEKYTSDLSLSITQYLEADFASSLYFVLDSFMARNELVLEAVDLVESKVHTLNHGMDTAVQSLLVLSTMSDEIRRIVQQTGHAAVLQQELINMTSTSAVSLTDSIVELSTFMKDELHILNATAHTMKSDLMRKPAGQWRDLLLPWMFETIARIYPIGLRNIMATPLIQISLAVLQILWQLVQILVSAGASWAMLVGRRSRRASTPNADSNDSKERVDHSSGTGDILQQINQPNPRLAYLNEPPDYLHTAQSAKHLEHIRRRASRPRVSRIPSRLSAASQV